MTVANRYSDVYYRDPALFGTQATVDRYLDDLAFTFSTSRAALRITAASKGLILGPVIFRYSDGMTIDVSKMADGMLMPGARNLIGVDMSQADWILVVEKEATFRAVTACVSQDPSLHHGIVLTAKGYPDIASREVLNLLATPSVHNGFSTKPLLALVDFDPDGINIYACYKYRATELPSPSITAALTRMKLIGISSHHLSFLENDQSVGSILILTTRDRIRAVNMLKNSDVAKEERIRLDLQRMLVLNTKAELQHLDGTAQELRDFLRKSIATML